MGKKATTKVLRNFDKATRKRVGDNVARGLKSSSKELAVVNARKGGAKGGGKGGSKGGPKVETLVARQNAAVRKRKRGDKPDKAATEVKPRKLAFDADAGAAAGVGVRAAKPGKAVGDMSIDEFLAGGFAEEAQDDEENEDEVEEGGSEEDDDDEGEDNVDNDAEQDEIDGEKEGDEGEEEDVSDQSSSDGSESGTKGRKDTKAKLNGQANGKAHGKANGKSSAASDEVSDEEEEQDEEDEEEQHKKDLARLKKKDPEFYKMLEKEGKELLAFGEEGNSSNASDCDEEEGEDEEAEADEQVHEEANKSKQGKRVAEKRGEVLTMSALKALEKRAFMDKEPSALKEAVYVFKLATRDSSSVVGDDDAESGGERYTITSDAVRQRVITSCVSNVGPLFDARLGVTAARQAAGSVPFAPAGRGKASPAMQPGWKRMEPLVKRFVTDLLRVLSQSRDGESRAFLLRKSKAYMVYVVALQGKVSRAWLKQLVELWGAGASADDAVRLSAYVSLRQLVAEGGKALLGQALRGCYLEFVRGCKSNGVTEQERIAFQARSLVELFGLDLSVSYELAFVYVRQLALHLRAAILSKTLEALRGVYSWQFLHCMRLWGAVLAQYPGRPSADDAKAKVSAEEQQLRSLIYPCIQIVTGAIRLNPTARYFPLRFHLVAVLNQLARASRQFVPVSHLLLDTLADSLFQNRKPAEAEKDSNGQMVKPPELESSIKLGKSALASAQVQSAMVARCVELLENNVECYRFSIGFPEYAFPVLASLRAFAKKTRVTKWRADARALVSKMEKWAADVKQRRIKLPFAPANVPRLHQFMDAEEELFRAEQDRVHIDALEKKGDKDLVNLDDDRDEDDEEDSEEDAGEEEGDDEDDEDDDEDDEDDDEEDDEVQEETRKAKRQKVAAKPAKKQARMHAHDEEGEDDVVQDMEAFSDDD
jgi:nucleolar complex protein 2